jgi:hypothetical protein
VKARTRRVVETNLRGCIEADERDNRLDGQALNSHVERRRGGSWDVSNVVKETNVNGATARQRENVQCRNKKSTQVHIIIYGYDMFE